MVLRKGLINRSLVASHMFYVRLLDGTKRMMRF
jgi:hypothetical protein